jgi:hypothetical protein
LLQYKRAVGTQIPQLSSRRGSVSCRVDGRDVTEINEKIHGIRLRIRDGVKDEGHVSDVVSFAMVREGGLGPDESVKASENHPKSRTSLTACDNSLLILSTRSSHRALVHTLELLAASSRSETCSMSGSNMPASEDMVLSSAI